VRSSSQFWNRERLDAGLLTEARKGNWTVVTGLRRFGKSSLALEVARRMTGPSAYVDLAGFHHEVSYGDTPAVAVEAILRTLVARLSESAAARYPAAVVPPLPTVALDAPALAAWLRALTAACGQSSGTAPPPLLLVVDEVEQL
jgi:AAA+ ATPase superfamily predicted ATPase